MSDRSRQASGEQDAIRHVAARLARQFPDLPAEQVERAVYGNYGNFDDSPVRDFVPVLVEQASRRRLAGHQPRHRA